MLFSAPESSENTGWRRERQTKCGKKAVTAHLQWWDKIVERKKNEGRRLTFLTEFGPPDYMPTLPYTRLPLADQWAINIHMMHLLRKRYSTI